MLGKDLVEILKKVNIKDYDKFLEEPREYGAKLIETLEVEEIISSDINGDKWRPLTQDEMQKGIEQDEEYRISELIIYRTNLEKDIGVQLYETKNNNVVYAVIVFDDNPDLSKKKQLKIPYWFENRNYFEDWLNQAITVYSIYPTEEHVVDVQAKLGSKTVILSIKEWGSERELTAIPLSMDLEGGFEAIEDTIYENIGLLAGSI